MAVLLGSTSVGTDGNDFETAGVQIASKYVASATGTVDTITVRTHTGNLATTVKAAVFSDNAGTPNAQIGNVVTITPTASTLGWFTSTAGAAAAVTSGTTYWLVFLGPSGGGQFQFRLFDSTTSAGTKDAGSALAAIRTPWGANLGTFTELIDAYAESTADNTPKPALPGMYTPQLVDRMWF